MTTLLQRKQELHRLHQSGCFVVPTARSEGFIASMTLYIALLVWVSREMGSPSELRQYRAWLERLTP